MSSIKTIEKDGITIVNFTDAKILDDTRIQQIGDDLLAAAADTKEGKLLLNFAGVSFMSSAMIGKLVLLSKKCKSTDVSLKICNISPNVAEVFKIMKLNKVFDIQKDLDKGMKSFDKKGWFG